MSFSTDSTIDESLAIILAELSDADGGRQSECEDGTDQSSKGAADQQQQQLLHGKMAKMEMENKLLKTELREQKVLAELNAVKAKVAKMEQEQQQKDIAFVDQFTKVQSDQKAILERICRMERAQQQKMHSLQEQIDAVQTERAHVLALLKASHDALVAKVEGRFSVLLENSWDASACHGDLAIHGPECRTVYYEGNGSGSRSVLAKHPILSSVSGGIFYFEMKVENVKSSMAIGLATKAMPLDGQMVGTSSDSCAYFRNGQLWLNGSLKECSNPTFSAGDVVGCGVILANRLIVFTKNGRRLDTPIFDKNGRRLGVNNFCISSPAAVVPLFPCVSLSDSGDQMEANFGPDFQFDVMSALC